MAISEYHRPPIPTGYQIFEERLEVKGVSYRKRAVRRFIAGRKKRLELERDPTNRHDRNAIRVIGLWHGFFRSRRALIGYVPREIAKVVVEGGYFPSIRPRLLHTYHGDRGSLEVLLQLLGPKELKHAYRDELTPVDDSGHYTDYVNRVKRLKKEGDLEGARELLHKLISKTEAEAAAKGSGWGVAPWYYEQLAIVYAKQKRYADEVEVLERYARQSKSPGVGPKKLATRLVKARDRLARS